MNLQVRAVPSRDEPAGPCSTLQGVEPQLGRRGTCCTAAGACGCAAATPCQGAWLGGGASPSPHFARHVLAIRTSAAVSTCSGSPGIHTPKTHERPLFLCALQARLCVLAGAASGVAAFGLRGENQTAAAAFGVAAACNAGACRRWCRLQPAGSCPGAPTVPLSRSSGSRRAHGACIIRPAGIFWYTLAKIMPVSLSDSRAGEARGQGGQGQRWQAPALPRRLAAPWGQEACCPLAAYIADGAAAFPEQVNRRLLTPGQAEKAEGEPGVRSLLKQVISP